MATAIMNGYHAADDLDDVFGDDDLADSTSSPFRQEAPTADGDNDELHALYKEAGIGADMDINDLNDRELEEGEKADDAVDFGDIDISDEELPDEHFAADQVVQQPSESDFLSGIEDIAADDLDDELFGGPSSPMHAPNDFDAYMPSTEPIAAHTPGGNSELASEHEGSSPSETQQNQPELDDVDDPQWRIQQELFAQSGKGTAPATEQENIEEWLKLEYPRFKRNELPFFTQLFPPRSLNWVGKIPAKPPKTIRPTKVNLELEQDQKAMFASAAVPVGTSRASEEGVTVVDVPTQAQVNEEDSSDESDVDEQLPGGVSMQDLNFICADFDTLSAVAGSDAEAEDLAQQIAGDDVDMFGTDDLHDFEHPIKKRKLGQDAHDIVTIHHYDMPSFDDPERLTRKLAQKVILDLNDPKLLVEQLDPDVLRARTRPGEALNGSKTLKDLLKGRFGTSNDAEYDLLKQNHQHKVRGQLGNMSIDHSIPALRLQYPYYKVKLPRGEARAFHRKRLDFRFLAFNFAKASRIKRKSLKGKTTKEIYQSTKDLSLADNSTALLLEYTEEHPMMLSQTGMGNKVVNYYRRKTKDDTSRPKGEIGETQVLLPEDRSPFYMFGHVDPGETVSALYNTMYRAPIYEQEVRRHDFLVTRETTGVHGTHFHLRNADHLYVVGQELPSVLVPGPHSRFVTSAAKNRLKAISFRIARRKKSHRIRVEDVTRHFPETTDMQNRQKMKEFMVFSKEHKEWEMKPGEAVPDEEYIQSVLRPDDVCLLESMQVGQQYLQDAGFAEEDDDDDEDGKDKQGLSVEQELAPWKTTKNFMQATQGKAMLTLHGEGDPSGRGEAFSFIKTSMKGGFRPQGGSVEDTLAATGKGMGGHSYNVARQQRSYEEAIRRIWDKQKQNLEFKDEHDDDMDDGVDGQEDSFPSAHNAKTTPRSTSITPAPSRRQDDETATSFSKRSTTSQGQRFLRITRMIRQNGERVKDEIIETNPAVIKQYLKSKHAREASDLSNIQITPTGQEAHDARVRKRLEDELARLERNKERRHQRENAKNKAAANSPGGTAMSPDGEPQTPAAGKQQQATQRKCANCGQVGHIKTNKKLCPLLNGTIKQEDGFNNAAFMGAPPTLT